MLKLTKLQLIQLLLLYSALAATAWYCYNFKRLWGPNRKRPFQCYDETLSRPFVEDTVPPQQLNILSIYIPVIIIIACELSFNYFGKETTEKSQNLLKSTLKCITVLSLFLIGLAVERLMKNFGKHKMARLRPNFLTVCAPVNTDGYKCRDLDDSVTMEEYKCSENSYPAWAVDAAFRSFPSGHASLSAYGMIFIVCYLQLFSRQFQLSKTSLSLLLIIMQICCILVAMFVGLSRVFDFRHHWSDVCAGFALGSSIALAINWYLKCHLKNIDIWLRRVSNQTSDEKVIKATYVNGNTNAVKESCSLV